MPDYSSFSPTDPLDSSFSPTGALDYAQISGSSAYYNYVNNLKSVKICKHSFRLFLKTLDILTERKCTVYKGNNRRQPLILSLPSWFSFSSLSPVATIFFFYNPPTGCQG